MHFIENKHLLESVKIKIKTENKYSKFIIRFKYLLVLKITLNLIKTQQDMEQMDEQRKTDGFIKMATYYMYLQNI